MGPARTDTSYRRKAEGTVSQVRSSVETAIVALEGQISRPLPAPYLSVLLASTEDEAAGAEAAFSSIQPPSGAADGVRASTLAVVGTAVDRLAALRIEARRGGIDRLRAHLAGLHASARRLDGLSARLGV